MNDSLKIVSHDEFGYATAYCQVHFHLPALPNLGREVLHAEQAIKLFLVPDREEFFVLEHPVMGDPDRTVVTKRVHLIHMGGRAGGDKQCRHNKHWWYGMDPYGGPARTRYHKDRPIVCELNVRD